MVREQACFKTYPNPTTGIFVLELTGETPVDDITVEIYGIFWEKVLTIKMNRERTHKFSLANKPDGLYFVRVITGSMSESGKIIKQ